MFQKNEIMHENVFIIQFQALLKAGFKRRESNKSVRLIEILFLLKTSMH